MDIDIWLTLILRALQFSQTFIFVAEFVPSGAYERVVGGAEITPHEFPSLLAGIGCGSTLLYPQWGMTAAHCTFKVSDYAKAGVHEQKGESWTNAERRVIIKIYRHPEHNNPSNFANDIALFKLDRPFNLSETIQPITLPQKGYVEYGKCAWVVGYGFTCTGGNEDCGPIAPHKADVPILTPEKCWEYIEYPYLNDSQICAGYDEGGKDGCQGDSGGPLYVLEDGKQIQVGITSYGAGCAQPKSPGAYTRVQYYLDWIEETIRKDGEDPNFQYPAPKTNGKMISAGVAQSICQQYSVYTEKGQIQAPVKERQDSNNKCGWFQWTPPCRICAPFHFQKC